MNEAYDVVVVGAGPAGCTVAALVAEAGQSVLLVDRDAFPRFHVGESLMPEVYWPLKRMGLLEQMQSRGFVRKQSVQFVSASGKESQPFFFPDHDPRECSTTWQVERSEFDQMMVEHAASCGADVRDETRVLDVLMEDARVVGVRLKQKDSLSLEVRARVVVDATGIQAMLANRMGLRRDDLDLKKVAIWSYFKGAARDPGPHGGATVILNTKARQSWFWFIPLKDDMTSVGVVGDKDYLVQQRGKPEEVFAEELGICEALQRRLSDASATEPFRIAKEFSYVTTQQAGDGWVLVGDALGFIDPIYSSGVFFALRSGELAADAIVSALIEDDVSGERLGEWTTEFFAGTQWIRKLVNAFYTNQFSFGQFLKKHPQHQSNLTDLLIGRIFEGNPGKMFEDMDPAIEQAICESE